MGCGLRLVGCGASVGCGSHLASPATPRCEHRRANTQALQSVFGVRARHVPLGYAHNLLAPPPLPEASKDLDVLFFGPFPSL